MSSPLIFWRTNNKYKTKRLWFENTLQKKGKRGEVIYQNFLRASEAMRHFIEFLKFKSLRQKWKNIQKFKFFDWCHFWTTKTITFFKQICRKMRFCFSSIQTFLTDLRFVCEFLENSFIYEVIYVLIFSRARFICLQSQ